VRVVRSDSIDDARVEELRGLEMAILSRHRVESQRDGAVVWFRKIEHGLTIKSVNVNIRHLLRREDWASQLLRREISGQISFRGKGGLTYSVWLMGLGRVAIFANGSMTKYAPINPKRMAVKGAMNLTS
jgi:hypothetical protein